MAARASKTLRASNYSTKHSGREDQRGADAGTAKNNQGRTIQALGRTGTGTAIADGTNAACREVEARGGEDQAIKGTAKSSCKRVT